MMRLLLVIILATAIFSSCNKRETLYTFLPSSYTGINFKNTITETDSFNVFTYEYIYNGGGVGIGDFDKDGKQDIFFAGNQVGSKLYLNNGSFKFRDITDQAGLNTTSWITGVSIADINQDGLDDIYLSTAYKDNQHQVPNLLFINQGMNKEGIPIFKEVSAEAGIGDSAYSSQAVFFDYDKDGDLDMYLCTNSIKESDRNALRGQRTDGIGLSQDKLYQNTGSLQPGGIPAFKDVSKAAGIQTEGWGLGVIAKDFNGDGWTDVYVGNDFQSDDHLYINNRNGTFTNRIGAFMPHISHNSMGLDMADMNNDGLEDLCVVDMLPDDNLRKKTMFGAIPNDRFEAGLHKGYQPQYVRNMLQLNLGQLPGDSSTYRFAEIGRFAGVHATDWSWSPLWMDADLDGNKDLLITNGYVKDITDLDFTSYSSEYGQFGTKEETIRKLRQKAKEIGEVKKPNFFFRNEGGLRFSDHSSSWGLGDPSFSNGAAYADLDNDGDLDLVMNNLNSVAFIYRNNAIDRNNTKKETSHFIGFEFEGVQGSRDGLNACIWIWSQGHMQYAEHTRQRGYLSSMENRLIFGLGTTAGVDSVRIRWNDGKSTRLLNPKVDVYHVLKQASAQKDATNYYAKDKESLLYEDTTMFNGWIREENPFNDFNYQFTLPHQLSLQGPPAAVADINGDGLADFYVGGSVRKPGYLMVQQPSSFEVEELLVSGTEKLQEETSAVFFDADLDGDADLYSVAGGNEFRDSAAYMDLFFRNEGKGKLVQTKLPHNRQGGPGSVVAAADYDLDGTVDLFIAGGVRPHQYPLTVPNTLFRNKTVKGANDIVFEDVSPLIEEMLEPGWIKSAQWIDMNGDRYPDLLVAGEFMPIKLYLNQQGKGFKKTRVDAFEKSNGWYEKLLLADFDHDGDLDIIAGNHGLNSGYHASVVQPLTIRFGDFNKDDRIDAFLFQYIQGREFPHQTRTQYLEQITTLRKRIYYFHDFGKMQYQDIFPEKERAIADSLQVFTLATGYFENLGSGKFRARPLPEIIQLSTVKDMYAGDLNNDGHPDLLVIGNLFTPEALEGRQDACPGWVFLGNGKGTFTPLSLKQSGMYVPGDNRAILVLPYQQQPLFIVVPNQGRISAFKLTTNRKL